MSYNQVSIPTLLCSSGFSVWGRGLLTEEMKLEAVVVTEAAAEEDESRKAFVKTVHIIAFNTNTRPTQLRRSNTGSCRTKPEIFSPSTYSTSIIHGNFGAKPNGVGV